MRQGVAIFAAAILVAASLPFIRDHDDAILELLGKAKVAVAGAGDDSDDKKIDPPALTDIDLANIDDRREVVTAPAHGKRNADLTLDSLYQRAAATLLRKGQMHEGSIVMTEVKTGRVLVWASFNNGRARDLAVEPNAPSASVFKIITSAALIEAGVPLNEKFCYPGGGERRISRRMLEANEKRDKYCASLGLALGRSLNIIFARQAHEHLDQDKLRGVAMRMGYGLDIPFDVPVKRSEANFPEDDLEFAQTAAGFWNNTLTPFQGANIALTIANGGEMIRQFIVERVVDGDGEPIYRRPQKRQVFKRVLDKRTAWAVARMMEQTVRNGTSFRTFHDRAGRPFLPDIRVAGKTGTLAKKNPETLYTWWVGFAPARNPEVALSVLVSNRGAWHVKGTHVAADMLRVYFADKKRPGVRFPPAFKGRRKKSKKSKKAKPPTPQTSAATAP